LTFDDGLANNYHVGLPILEKYEAPAIFFISTQHIKDPENWLSATRALARAVWQSENFVPKDIAAEFYDGMSIEQLSACAKHPLISIGSHTVSHPYLTQCEQEMLSFELVQSKRFLEGITDQYVDLFAYPTGNYNAQVAQAVQEAGYQAAFALSPLGIGLPRFEIPRVDIYEANNPYLSLKLSGLHRKAIGRIRKC